jgi:hypothetical protein
LIRLRYPFKRLRADEMLRRQCDHLRNANHIEHSRFTGYREG